MITSFWCAARNRLTNALLGTGFPCHRHGSPSKHCDIKIFIPHA
jgi:hypothetical protein